MTAFPLPQPPTAEEVTAFANHIANEVADKLLEIHAPNGEAGFIVDKRILHAIISSAIEMSFPEGYKQALNDVTSFAAGLIAAQKPMGGKPN
jgi:hypothetical protein